MSTLCHQKKFIYFFCMYKTYLISAEGYENAKVDILRTQTGEIWVCMTDVKNVLGVINISDLILKEIYGIYETKNPTKEQNKEYKMTEGELFKTFYNLSEKAIDGFRKKFMIPDFEIPMCPEFEVKSKIGKRFKKQNPIEKYSVRIYEIDRYLYEHYEKRYKLIKMGVKTYYLELIFILISAI